MEQNRPALAGAIAQINASKARNVTDKSGPGLGLMERQRLKMWLAHAMAQIDTVPV